MKKHDYKRISKALFHSLLFFTGIGLIMAFTLQNPLNNKKYPWLENYFPKDHLKIRIQPPVNFYRNEDDSHSFSNWLRSLQLKQGKPDVHLYNGERKRNQQAHYAVCDIDCGKEDLQQCADAVMRLRAEYLFSVDAHERIHFNFTSGDKASWKQWAEGFRPKIAGSKVTWEQKYPKDYSYLNFKKYLRTVFIYAGSASLEKELEQINIKEMAPGDVFIQGGFPGHAVIVIDVAENKSGNKVFLLAQSYMPAQEIHILKNDENPELSPWYDMNFGEVLHTPEWSFRKSDLRRFRN